MTTIYKVICGERRRLLSLPLSVDNAVGVIKRVAVRMGWEHTDFGQGITIKFPDESTADYCVEGKLLSLQENTTHERP